LRGSACDDMNLEHTRGGGRLSSTPEEGAERESVRETHPVKIWENGENPHVTGDRGKTKSVPEKGGLIIQARSERDGGRGIVLSTKARLRKVS